MRRPHQTKNIFCLEGPWENNLKDQSSVRPVLDLLHTCQDVKFIHRDCATKTEFEFYLNEWVKKRYDDYPILYLAFHGEVDHICFANKEKLELDDIAAILEAKCDNRIVVFGSCSTVCLDARHLKRFLKITGALAICGYKDDVDWMRSMAFELLLLNALQENEFSGRGLPAIKSKLIKEGKLFKELDFGIVTL